MIWVSFNLNCPAVFHTEPGTATRMAEAAICSASLRHESTPLIVSEFAVPELPASVYISF
jgi:hypothetical protein